MTLATHAAIGAAAASFFPEYPWIAFGAGVVSHFVIDALPHWDYKEWLWSLEEQPNRLESDFRYGSAFWHDLGVMGADALIGLVLTLIIAWLVPVSLTIALIGAGAGLYPDLLTFAYFKARRTAPWLAQAYEPVQMFHSALQWRELHHMGYKAPLGLSLQAALIVAVVVLVIIGSR
jgi:hypothetical protein